MSSIEGQNASTSLPAGSASLATGNVADFGAIYLNTVVVVVATAALTAGTLLLEGSLDGNNWYQISTLTATTITGAGVTVYTATIPARYVRSRISVAITGGTITTLIGAAGA